MVRWEPGAKERLQAAALRLFVEHGYERTTVQELAEAAGLTERTFFRHFADKREVLFVGQEEYAATFLRGVAEAREGATAFELIEAALRGAAGFFPDERRPWSRERQRVLDANPALLERESLKQIALGDALTAAFLQRGIPLVDARLAAHTAVVAFMTAFRGWIDDERPMVEVQQEVLERLSAILPAPSTV